MFRYYRFFYRSVFSILIALFHFISACLIVFLPISRFAKKRFMIRISSLCAGMFIINLGIKKRYIGLENFDKSRPWYIMGNHVSFTDIFLILHGFKTLFITSMEMKHRPILGQICVMAGCLFVNRRKITTLKSEIPEIGVAFKNNLNVCLFPEATCSNGEALLPFKGALMGAVSGTDAGILPICIMYRKIEGRPFTTGDFKEIGYFGGMKFAPQFVNLMMLKSLEVELEVLEPIEPGDMDRKALSAVVFEKINKRYQNYLKEIGAGDTE